MLGNLKAAAHVAVRPSELNNNNNKVPLEAFYAFKIFLECL